MIQDGFGGKTSLNGTWVVANSMMPVYDGMMFKSGNKMFSIELLKF